MCGKIFRNAIRRPNKRPKENCKLLQLHLTGNFEYYSIKH